MTAMLGRNPRGRGGCRWPKAAVRVQGAVGKLGRSRGGVGEEWGRENEWSSASGERAAQRQRDGGEREGGKVGGPGRGGATRSGGAVGPGPDWRTAPGSGPSAALVGDVCRARVPAGQSGKRGS
jgi:hypothetical protein